MCPCTWLITIADTLLSAATRKGVDGTDGNKFATLELYLIVTLPSPKG
jgi:hypothetical protein